MSRRWAFRRRRPRNGRFVEIVGTYDPQKKPALVQLKNERVEYWISKGAQPSDTVRSFLKPKKKVAESSTP